MADAPPARSKLEEEVLAAIRPSDKEEAKMARIAQDLVERCKEAAAFFGLSVEPRIVGSFPKKTHLKGADLDLFLLFDPAVPLDQLKEEGLKIAKSVIAEGETRYAEHPYLRGRVEDVRVDVVPAYKVRSPRELKTAVDRTPFHNEFVREHLSPSRRDDVRLLKRFLLGINAYGSELAVQGFSGYLCELLVIRFGSFGATLAEASTWREGPVHYIEGTIPPEMLTNARRDFPEPLVFIDPVDPGRNVASSVSPDSYGVFVLAAREYLREARPLFFFPNAKQQLTPSQVRDRAQARGTRIVGIAIRGSELVDDVWVPQLRKSMRSLEKLLTSYGFNVVRADVYWGNDALFLFELAGGRLPTLNKHIGPAAAHENAREFLEKWSGRAGQLSKVYVEEGRLMVDVAREFTDATELLRAKSKAVSHGKNVGEVFAEGFHVLEIDEIAREPYRGFTSDFLQPGLPWSF